MSLETMTKLATTTVGVTAQSSISFTNIPQGYTDLVIKVSGRTAAAQGVAELSFNSVTTNLSSRIIFAIGSGTPGSASYASALRAGYIIGTDYTASTFSNNEIYIANYSSNTFKLISIDSVTERNATEAYSSLNAGLWSNPSPITSLTFTVLNNNTGTPSTYTEHSTFTLYGIKNAQRTAGNSIKATGGNIVFDGTYVYHVFNSTGAFVPTSSLTADVLVVAGGGSGGTRSGGYNAGSGGGGAGGLLTFASQSLSPTSYVCTIGAGGAARAATSLLQGNSGANSQFGNLTTAVGGGGGAAGTNANYNGANGGSGGGANYSSGVPGTGTPGQGNNGGAGAVGQAAVGGGGGGAGAVGGNANGGTSTGGVGGIGATSVLINSIGIATGAGELSGGNYYFAGGGGGGAYIGAGGLGGLGGGGKAGSNIVGNVYVSTAGAPNTGGGGGADGESANSTGSAGGSGIIVIRYKG